MSPRKADVPTAPDIEPGELLLVNAIQQGNLWLRQLDLAQAVYRQENAALRAENERLRAAMQENTK